MRKIRVHLASVGLATLVCCAANAAEVVPPAWYVQASRLNMRAQPDSQAPVLRELPINEAVTLVRRRDEPWCEIEARRQPISGFVDCRWLDSAPVTLNSLERELASATLALHRALKLTMVDSNGVGRGLSADSKSLLAQAAPLFSLLERHFALSPSLYTLADYDGLITVLVGAEDAVLTPLARSKLPQLLLMRSELERADTQQAGAFVRRSAVSTLRAVLAGRQANAKSRRQAAQADLMQAGNARPAAGTSVFHSEKWVVGWAGGPLVQREKRSVEGVNYRVTFDGTGYWSLAQVYEMAKTLQLPVKAAFKKLPAEYLSHMPTMSDPGAAVLTLSMDMPVWAITDEGLIAGRLRQARIAGDACMVDASTGVQLVFARPLQGNVHGVFATNVTVDPQRAKVSVRRKSFLAPSQSASNESTLSDQTMASVDLDGDGIDDLRTIVKTDADVVHLDNQEPATRHAVWDAKGPDLLRVAGWYAANVYALEANEDGWWRMLSLYNLVTCT